MKYLYLLLPVCAACALKVDAATRRALGFGLGEYKGAEWSSYRGDAVLCISDADGMLQIEGRAKD